MFGSPFRLRGGQVGPDADHAPAVFLLGQGEARDDQRARLRHPRPRRDHPGAPERREGREVRRDHRQVSAVSRSRLFVEGPQAVSEQHSQGRIPGEPARAVLRARRETRPGNAARGKEVAPELRGGLEDEVARCRPAVRERVLLHAEDADAERQRASRKSLDGRERVQALHRHRPRLQERFSPVREGADPARGAPEADRVSRPGRRGRRSLRSRLGIHVHADACTDAAFGARRLRLDAHEGPRARHDGAL
ncbi:MAG: hypothetical protein BWY66_01296 [bacterium ADurb.Bin374]|nr:MAG: hypothetical protein BWY66_01296 [bacterium ADurb.Bin374]